MATRSANIHDGRYGSNSEVRARNWAVSFTLKYRRRQPGLSGPKRANAHKRKLTP